MHRSRLERINCRAEIDNVALPPSLIFVGDATTLIFGAGTGLGVGIARTLAGQAENIRGLLPELQLPGDSFTDLRYQRRAKSVGQEN
jgi:hypothetical protein